MLRHVGERIAPLAGALLMLVACRGADPSNPPEIVYGEDVCDQCGMIVSEPRFAAALWSEGPNGPESHIFDDVGEMIEYTDEHFDAPIVSRFVHDYESEDWIDAETATYLMESDVETPMSSGVIAFENSSDAVLFSGEHGGYTLSFVEMTETVLVGSPQTQFGGLQLGGPRPPPMVYETPTDEEMTLP